MSPLAARVAATYLAMQDEEAPEETQDQVALPRRGPAKMVLQKNLDNLSRALEEGNHGGFKRGLSDLNDNFARFDANETEAWTPKSINVGSRVAGPMDKFDPLYPNAVIDGDDGSDDGSDEEIDTTELADCLEAALKKGFSVQDIHDIAQQILGSI